MQFDYSQVKAHKLYPFVKPVLYALSHIVYDASCTGRENVPSEGKLIIACNHVAFSDPALIVANCPRTLHYMAKSELFEKPLFSFIFTSMNAFPVRRCSSDRKALRYATEILKRDWVLGIFPEGRRIGADRPPTQARNGIGYLAGLSGADVLPCCIYKKNRRIRSKVIIRFGRVIRNSELGFEGKNRSFEIKRASEIIMNRITELWEEESCRLK